MLLPAYLLLSLKCSRIIDVLLRKARPGLRVLHFHHAFTFLRETMTVFAISLLTPRSRLSSHKSHNL